MTFCLRELFQRLLQHTYIDAPNDAVIILVLMKSYRVMRMYTLIAIDKAPGCEITSRPSGSIARYDPIVVSPLERDVASR